MIKTKPNGVQLPEVIAIDEYKADTDEGKYQLIIANATHEPIDILPNRCKETIHHYLSQLWYLERYTSMSSELKEAYENFIKVATEFNGRIGF